MSEEQRSHHQLHDLLRDADLTIPLHELVQDSALLEEPLTFYLLPESLRPNLYLSNRCLFRVLLRM